MTSAIRTMGVQYGVSSQCDMSRWRCIRSSLPQGMFAGERLSYQNPSHKSPTPSSCVEHTIALVGPYPMR